MERRQKDFEKLDNIERVVVGLANDVKTHIKVSEMSEQLLNEKLENLSSEIKGQRNHFDHVITRNKEHFDEKIATCHDNIHSLLKEEYATKAEIHSIKDETILEQTNIRTKEIEDAKKDIMTRIRNNGALVMGTIILLITIVTYIVGLK